MCTQACCMYSLGIVYHMKGNDWSTSVVKFIRPGDMLVLRAPW